MKLRFLLLSTLTLAAAWASPPITTAQDGTPLEWLPGCWISPDGNVEETWIAARQGSLLFGYSVTSKNGEAVFFEQLRIELVDDKFALHASPRGAGATRFEETARTVRSITFSNPDHDYPQVIAYERIGAELHATISLVDGSNSGGWRYEACAL